MTTIQTRIIVLLSDGTRLKGFARDFNPARPHFHLIVAGPQGETGEQRQIAVSDLDAVFFVRDFAFDRERRYEPEGDLASMTMQPMAGARAIEVTTKWGEVLRGLTYGYHPQRPGFFVFPTEPLERALNLERAYVTRQAVSRVDFPPSSGSARGG
ncbi:MAG TPA: hypothetical protein VFS53_04375 [Gemmatimonadota bacterium]|nr:hypothetical protein [Gemmatimonadota bacterium]